MNNIPASKSGEKKGGGVDTKGNKGGMLSSPITHLSMS